LDNFVDLFMVKRNQSLSSQPVVQQTMAANGHGLRTGRAFRHFKTDSHYLFSLPAKLLRKIRFGLEKARVEEKGSRRVWNRSTYFFGPIQDYADLRANYLGLRKVLRSHPLPKYATIASIGCGAGSQEMLLSEENPFFRIDAVDNAPRLVRHAKQLQKKEFKSTIGKVKFTLGSFLNPGLEKRKYSCVVSLDAFHWEKNYKQSLKNMVLLLKPNGLIIITYRSRGTNRMDAESREYVKREMTPEKISAELNVLGMLVSTIQIKPHLKTNPKYVINMIVARKK
jgi:ubiquinone/menaquinone biosynthesis C-methylase UbiE